MESQVLRVKQKWGVSGVKSSKEMQENISLKDENKY